MKLRPLLAALALAALFLSPVVALAAAMPPAPGVTATPAVPATSPWLGVIPLAIPILVAVLKGFLPNLPKAFLPLIAAALGLALAGLDYFTGSFGGNPMAVLFLGAAGTGVREILDQLKKLPDLALR